MDKLKSFAQAMSIIQLEKNNASQWHQAFDNLTSISRLEAYYLLSKFPDLIVNPPVSPSEDEAIAWSAAEIEYSAKAAWLLSWRTDRKDPRLLYPKRYSYPENCFFEYEDRAKLSELLFNMIDAWGDRLAVAQESWIDSHGYGFDHEFSFNALKPCTGQLWLMCEASECRSKLSPQIENQSIYEAYCQAKSYRDGNLAPLDNPKPIEPLEHKELEMILDRSEVPNHHCIANFHHSMIAACRHLANIDRQFKGAFWQPYWSVHKSVYSRASKNGFQPVPSTRVGSPKHKKKSKKSRGL